MFGLEKRQGSTITDLDKIEVDFLFDFNPFDKTINLKSKFQSALFFDTSDLCFDTANDGNIPNISETLKQNSQTSSDISLDEGLTKKSDAYDMESELKEVAGIIHKFF